MAEPSAARDVCSHCLSGAVHVSLVASGGHDPTPAVAEDGGGGGGQAPSERGSVLSSLKRRAEAGQPPS
jgi:hypothetical protein